MKNERTLSDRFVLLTATLRQSADSKTTARLASIAQAIETMAAIPYERLRKNVEGGFGARLDLLVRLLQKSTKEAAEDAWRHVLEDAIQVEALLAARACGCFLELAASEDLEGIRALMACGYDINARTLHDHSPLDLCLTVANSTDILEETPRAIRCLLKAGALVEPRHLTVRDAGIRAQLEEACLRRGVEDPPVPSRIPRGGPQ